MPKQQFFYLNTQIVGAVPALRMVCRQQGQAV